MSAQTRTYRVRPPPTARAARRAWDYFQRTRATARRPLIEVFYSPNYDYIGPHWCCEIGMLESDTLHWNFSKEQLMFSIAASTLADSPSSHPQGDPDHDG